MPKKLMKAAKKQNPPWPAPKRRKARSLTKAFPAMKRKVPKVAYVRDQKKVMKVDKRKMRWGRPVHMLASLQGRSLLRLLRSDGLLQKWEGKSCPRCGDGFLGDLYFDKVKQVWAHRCKKRGCQFRLQPHDYHPIFFAGSGVSQTSLSLQAAILCCALSGVPVSSVPALLDVHPKPVERIYTNLEVARSRYVQLTEKKIIFGANKKWSDVEADEVDLGKEELIKAAKKKASAAAAETCAPPSPTDEMEFEFEDDFWEYLRNRLFRFSWFSCGKRMFRVLVLVTFLCTVFMW